MPPARVVLADMIQNLILDAARVEVFLCQPMRDNLRALLPPVHLYGRVPTGSLSELEDEFIYLDRRRRAGYRCAWGKSSAGSMGRFARIQFHATRN